MVGCWKSECTVDVVLAQQGCFEIIHDADALLIIRHIGRKSGLSLPVTAVPALFKTLQALNAPPSQPDKYIFIHHRLAFV